MNASISKAGCNNRSADRVSGLCPNCTKARMARVKGSLVILLSCFCLVFTSCEKNKEVIGPSAGQYEVPLQTDDGWETASLYSVGMDEAPLLKLLQKLNGTADHRIHSLLIVKDGKLVFEEYFPGEKFKLAQPTGEFGFDMYDTHTLCSVTKSVTSALIGIAIDKGFIQSVDQKIFDFFPEYSDLLTSAPEKNTLTLEHLLTMTSGLQWDDESTSYFDPRNDLYQLFRSQDPIRYILSKDLLMVPGTVFDYANCNTNVLGEIVRQASEARLDDFAENYLFSKLGITDFEWQMLPNDVVFCSGDLMLRPRDMAKFGYLFLNDGIWKGEQVISREWIHISTPKIIDLEEYSASYAWADGYGYQWWLWEDIYGVEYPAYLAAGWGGQWIIVSPTMNTVIVSTAGNYYTDTKIPIEEILVDYIIPSLSQKMLSVL